MSIHQQLLGCSSQLPLPVALTSSEQREDEEERGPAGACVGANKLPLGRFTACFQAIAHVGAPYICW